MRSIKKTFYKTCVTIKKHGEIITQYDEFDKLSIDDVAVKYFKQNGYDKDIEIEVQNSEETYVMSAQDFIKHAEKIEF